MNGESTLNINPYFYDQDIISLDAKGYTFDEIALINGDEKKVFDNYHYVGTVLTLELDKTYSRNDTIQLYLKYTAKPNLLKLGGSSASIAARLLE